MSRFHDKLSRRRWAQVRRRVFDRNGYRCKVCGKAGKLECDHVIPLEDGGDMWDPDNLQAICRGCHIDKTARARLAKRRTDPRVDAWFKFAGEI